MKKETLLKVLFLVVDTQMTKFMQCVDVFENGKVVGQLMEGSFGCNLPEGGNIKSAINCLFDKINSIDIKMPIPFFICVEIDGEKNTTIPAIITKPIQSISDGEKWFMLDDYLTARGYETKTNEQRFVLEAKINGKQ